MSELPEGWTGCLISDVAQVIGGGTPDTKDAENFSESEGIAWLTPADLSGYSNMYISRGKRFLTKAGFTSSSARILPKGAVLFSSRAPIGYVAIAANEISTNQGFKSFIPASGVIPEYLYFYLKFAKPLADELASGTTFAEISGKNAARIPLLLAPTNEQRRIVTKLETLLGKVDAYQQRFVKIPRVLKRFRQAVLTAACSGRLTADWREFRSPSSQILFAGDEQVNADLTVETPDAWDWTTLNSLCEKSRGISYGVIKLGSDVSDGIPCLRTSDVKPLKIDATDVKRIAPKISAEYKRTILNGGEVLVNVRGTLGGVAVVPPEMNGWNISREVALVPLDSSVDAHFISFWIAAKHSQNWLSNVERGVAYTGINLEDLRLLPIAVPSLSEQQEIVRHVETLFKLADQIEARYHRAKPLVDKLPQSILAKAFRGELVPTEAELARREGRDYEPASVLLERIKSERAEHAQGRKGKAMSQPKPTRTRKRDGSGISLEPD